MTGVTINLFDELGPALQRALDAVDDLSAPMSEISEKWLESTRDRFDRQVDPLGVPWVPRKDTENKKPLLVKDQHLRNQLDNDFGPDFAEVGVQATGGPAIYGRIHNEGGVTRPFRANSKRAYGAFAVIVIPRRQYIGDSQGDRTMAVEVLTQHLQSAFNGDARAVP